ncbi:Yip1 family protein [Aestuariivita boseongensis]|uniref:Yip1 family protein n=1 Tax=Aestuariivita boseongensis TaxID=1470562 RepID=UPI000680A9D2|nr:Yip1 family protein [Aestuariivita boseongensis]
MTLTPSLKDLVVLTIQDPAEAARQLMALKLDRGTLWTAVFLMAVLNTLLAGLNNLLLPGTSPFPGLFDVPAAYFFMVAGGLVLTILAIFWGGRAFGGQGSMEDVMVVIAWLQFMRVLVQAVALVLLLTIPVLSMLLVLAAAFVGLWILVHFVDQAHRFGSLGKAAGVLIAAFVCMVVGLSILLSMIGVGAVGGGYV